MDFVSPDVEDLLYLILGRNLKIRVDAKLINRACGNLIPAFNVALAQKYENNIKFGRPDATHQQVVEAAKKARCHDFIMELPDEYNTMLGEGGANLSGGERQRISIAMAVFKGVNVTKQPQIQP